MDVDAASGYLLRESFEDSSAVRLDPQLPPGVSGWALSDGEWSPPSPITCTRDSGRKLGDFVFATYSSFVVVSPAAIRCLEQQEITGWTTFPVEIRGVEEAVDGYVGLVITGRAGPVDLGLGERVMHPLVPGGPALPHVKGLHPRLGTWDGSDLFKLAESDYQCMTARVHAALEEAGLRGARYERMADEFIYIP